MKCVLAASCPYRSYANLRTFRCEQCPSNCLACSYFNGTSVCSNCTNNTYLGTDGLCHPITECKSTQYMVAPASFYTDTHCAPLTVCDGGQYQTIAPTLTSDRTCVEGTACNASHYQSVPITYTTDRQCSLCRNCSGANETIYRQCTGLADAVCAARPLCNPNPCANNGTCINNQGWNFTCACPSYFIGTTCTIDIRVCTPNP